MFFIRRNLLESRLTTTLLYLGLVLFLFTNEVLYLTINDDFALLNLLRNGSPNTLILSYPVSYVLSELYVFFPTVQWYSILLLIASLIAIGLYHAALRELIGKASFDRRYINVYNILGFLIHVFLLLNITVTSVTVWFFFTSSFYYLVSGKYASIVAFSLLLGFDVALGLLPLFFCFNIFYFKLNIKLASRLSMFFLLSASFILCQILLPSDEYRDWLKWNSARAYYKDLRQEPSSFEYLSLEQFKVLKEPWWTYDERMLPSSNVINSTLSKLDIVLNQITSIKLSTIQRVLSNDMYKVNFAIILVVSLWLLTRSISFTNRIGIVLILIFIISLILVRNVERVSLWLLTGTAIVFLARMRVALFESNQGGNKEKCIGYFSTLALLVIFIFGSYNDYNRNRELKMISSEIKKEFYSIKANYAEAIFIPSINFPLKGLPEELFLGELFREDEFIDYKHNSGIGPAGWLSRHPFFYDFYTSFTNEQEFDFYQLLISDNVYFIGYGDRVDSRFIDYYNQYAPIGWHHIIEVIKFDNLSLAQFRLVKSN